MKTLSLVSVLTLLGCAGARGSTSPKTTKAVDPGDVELHWLDSDPSGTRPVLVCLHAIGHGSGDFAELARALPEWRVLALDFPSHGRSGVDSVPASAVRYEQLVVAWLAKLGVTRAVVLGNSIGGATAVRVAVSQPTLVRAVVLANPGGLDPGGSSLLGKLFIGDLVRHFEWGARGEARFGPWFERYYADILRTEASRARREAIVAAGYESAAVLAQAWESFRSPEADLSALVPRVAVPTLVTWADLDGIVSFSRSEANVKRLPRATVVHFGKSGHAAFLEEPEAFLAALRPFLGALEP